jgi:hypothetical protein
MICPMKRGVSRSYGREIRFGNGEMRDLNEIRLKVSICHTLVLNLLSSGSQGRVDEFMKSQGEGFVEMRQSPNWVAASLRAKSTEEFMLTPYAEDGKSP